ncbi:OmpA family protein [Anaeromyxobacter oryzisoli]|uniref:OmpA family protein n=1 Tax=Anaeromyxobacter oryzisoli TaxID=2925408 RepID=UPI001F56AF5C|nr:OmpA family protein [Anaeromyxobacter sp. SG63]
MDVRSAASRIALALAGLACASAASAQQLTRPKFDLERLWLDPSARGSLVVGTGEPLTQGEVRAAVTMDWEKDPLVFTRDGDIRGRGLGEERTLGSRIVEDRLTAHLNAAFGLWDHLELGLGLPVVAYQNGGAGDRVFGSADKAGVGAPVVGLRWGALGQDRGAPVNLAVGLQVEPQWDDNVMAWGANRGWILAPHVEVGHRFGGFLLGADVGGRLRTEDAIFTNGERLSHEVLAGVVAATTGAPLRFELSARGAFNFDGLSQSAEVLGGARYAMGPAELYALAGPGFMEAPGTPTFRVLAGVAFATRRPTAPPAAAPAPQPAAPAPVAAKPAVRPPPDPCAPGQRHTPAQCPNLDDDGDGIPNGQDRCPLQPGPAATKGCPDSDGDGIPDLDDKCPTVKGLPEYQGCPPPARAEIKKGKIDIKEKVFFDPGKASIQERSNALLDDIASLIKANPGAGVIVIEGHTDSTGRADLNRKLSAERAGAVKAALVARGVDASRLEAAGYGSARPVGDNRTAAGREQNRRVEFVIKGVPERK